MEPISPSGSSHLIVDSAMKLIAASGVEGTSVRAVARDAGVSPALVIHHFGSKKGLVEACDHRVIDAVDSGMAEIVAGGATESLTATLAEIAADTEMLAYLLRSMTEGGVVGDHLFDGLYATTVSAVEQMEANGTGRPTEDLEMRSLLLLALDVGMVLLSHHASRVLGAPLETPEITKRWVKEEMELLTHGVLIAPDEPGNEEA